MPTSIITDGCGAASRIAYAFTECAAVYPITPSSTMAEAVEAWAAEGKTNLLGQVPTVQLMQSEAGAAGVLHGAAACGTLCTTFTASQGLLLMIPTMYKLAGELLPCVFHVSARSLSTHALSIFGDHSDVMACRQTGFAMLCASGVQEAADFALCAHVATLRSSVPFLHFFDGFRTSHELQRISLPTEDELRSLLPTDALNRFRARALDPGHPHQSGTAQNPDVYFQNREAAEPSYAALPGIVEAVLSDIAQLTGRRYHLVDYFGAPNAERVIVCMGSACDTAHETVNALLQRGEKVGLVKVRLYRPFPAQSLLSALPRSVRAIAVLDRTREMGSEGDPLYLDVVSALQEGHRADVRITSGCYGLGGKELTPGMVKAALDSLKQSGPTRFTLGIHDDVMHRSLPWDDGFHAAPKGTTACRFYGIGSDGTVGTVKAAAKLLGEQPGMQVQAFFAYDSRKSGGLTVSHLRYGPEPIRSAYLVTDADFVACHHPGFLTQVDMLSTLKEGGTFLLACPWDAGALEEQLPGKVRRTLARRHIRLYTLNAAVIAEESGLPGRTGIIMQAAFLHLMDILTGDDLIARLSRQIRELYGRKGDEVVERNLRAVSRALESLREMPVPKAWAEAEEPLPVAPPSEGSSSAPSARWFRQVALPMLRQEGDQLPVSAFAPDGRVPTATSRYEKRGIAWRVPRWDQEKCIRCGLCSMVCPHACIRAFLLPGGAEAPRSFETISDPAGAYRVQVSPLDCTGCGSCVNICPAPGKALVWETPEEARPQQALWDFAQTLPEAPVPSETPSVRTAQFLTPLMEFSGACAGCGETPYLRLLTQLFGPRLLIANATGCSSIYGGSAPICPYGVNHEGHGPAWASSLFENNAEFGCGMALAWLHRRQALKDELTRLLHTTDAPEALRQAVQAWMQSMADADAAQRTGDALLRCCASSEHPIAQLVLRCRTLLPKPSVWLVGGDGWAYDIGFGGLDHVLAQHIDLNVLVLDTEVYSNTGGQASKSTPRGAQARFAAGGKHTPKKDLGRMAMLYGHVYVAQVAMGANPGQLLRAMWEAERYPGPSLLIAYAPCISHGLPDMGQAQQEMKRAVQCGYWPLYRYHPGQEQPLTLDSPAPKGDYAAFLMGENRYAALHRQHPEEADQLFAAQQQDAAARLAALQRMAGATPI